MPKLILLDNCVVNFRDDRGGQHHKMGDEVDVPKDEAYSLVRVGRAKFMSKSDDFDKAGTNTADKDLLEQLKPSKGGKAGKADTQAQSAA